MDTQLQTPAVQAPASPKAKAATDRSARHVLNATPSVMAALNDPQYDFRTVAGIAKETHIPASQVRQILQENRDQVRISPIATIRGETLYAPRSRRITWRERLAKIQAYLAKSA